MGAIMLIDYETLIKISPILYGIFIILLIAVLFTSPVNGATSWFDIGFFSFQPGEFAKVFVILFLALFKFHPIIAKELELSDNLRAHSAKLRVFERRT